MQTPTNQSPKRRFNSGPRLHSENPEWHQNGTKSAGSGATPDLVFPGRLARALRWLSVLLCLRRPEMIVVCAWCEPKRVVRTVPCRWSSAGMVSHTICPQCRDYHFPAIKEAGRRYFRAERIDRDLFRTIVGDDWAEALNRKLANPVADEIHARFGKKGVHS